MGTGGYRNTWRAIGIPGNWEAGNTGLGTGSYRNTWELTEGLVTGGLGIQAWGPGAPGITGEL